MRGGASVGMVLEHEIRIARFKDCAGGPGVDEVMSGPPGICWVAPPGRGWELPGAAPCGEFPNCSDVPRGRQGDLTTYERHMCPILGLSGEPGQTPTIDDLYEVMPCNLLDVLAVISYPPIPILELGPVSFSLHGVFAAVGFLVGTYYSSNVLGRRGFEVAAYQSVMTWSLVGGLLGARWLTIPAEWAANGVDLSELWSLTGNFSIMGGFTGGILVAVYRMRMVGLKVWPTLDGSTFGLAIGTILGRVGDLAIVEHLGGPTEFFLGFGIRPGYDVAPQHNQLECSSVDIGEFCGVFHHTGLYDMIGAMVLFGALVWVYRRSGWRLRYGQLFMGWVVWYGLQRFLIDFTRLSLDINGDKELGVFTWSQWSGLSAAVVALGILVWFGRRNLEVTSENDVEFAGAVLE